MITKNTFDIFPLSMVYPTNIILLKKVWFICRNILLIYCTVYIARLQAFLVVWCQNSLCDIEHVFLKTVRHFYLILSLKSRLVGYCIWSSVDVSDTDNVV